MISSKKRLWMLGHPLILASVLGAALLSPSQSYGIPAFARKYQMECTMCHEPVPRLNEFGYKFRAAGFRLPSEIGKGEASDDYSNYIAARVVVSGTYQSTVGSDNNTGVNTTALNNINFGPAAIYPLCGAFGGHISAFSEFEFTPGEGIDIDNAFLRFTFGDTASFWSFRVGIFHPIEGYGASDADAMLGASSQLFPNSPATTLVGGSPTSSLYSITAAETGIEAGWNADRLSVRAGIFNGGYADGSPLEFQSAVGGSLSKPMGTPSYNAKEYRLFANYMLDEHGGSIAAYGFTGSIDLPNPATSVASDPAAMFPDRYNRYGVFATSPTFSGLKLLMGLGLGTDQEWISDPAILPFSGKVADSTSSSMGYFGELDYRLDKDWSFGGRYDFFDPMTGTNYQNNEVNAISVFANFCANNGLVVAAELMRQTTLEGVDSKNDPLKQNDYSATIRAFFIW
ncbi:MAG: hypothetical protein Q8922_00235 [Bacteroidota bacterium]|nr:hypothetical protein [Bacteroidota bacterium]MDP4232461.1 hypothetical protein [Bacteroidota bacterium]MDP4241597.1 hypothetical protein [Bacteroidota bacterium]MDP4286341.1 hypothetical protein [Bacteroidota bacterium]